MSTFEIKAYKIESVEPHPNADRLDIIKLEGMDYILISAKGLRKIGDVVLYVPSDSLIPEYLLRQGYWDEARGKGMLSGSLGNRVRPKRLRGVFSEGLIFPCTYKMGSPIFDNGEKRTLVINYHDNYAEFLGITKYEYIPPANMSGKHLGAFIDLTINYDFDSIQKNKDLFYKKEIIEEKNVVEIEGKQIEVMGRVTITHYDKPDEVWISEKIHGTLCMFGIAAPGKENEKFYKNRIYFTSKGLGKSGILLDHTDETNVYVRALKKYDLFEKLFLLSEELNQMPANLTEVDGSILIFGEVFGSVQDLKYGIPQDIDLRLFDCAFVFSHEEYMPGDFSLLKELSARLSVPLVPVLYTGPFSPEKVKELTDGMETVSGKSTCIREGVVIKTTYPEWDTKTRRKIRKAAKSVSENYHERKGVTTEFQ